MTPDKPKYGTLVLFTDAFPFGAVTEDNFIMPEMGMLAAAFSRVIVVPTTALSEKSAAVRLPGNVEICTDWLDYPLWRSRLRRALLVLTPRVWKSVGRSSGDLSFALAAEAYRRFIKKWIREKGISVSSTLFYSFWLGLPACALAALSEESDLSYIVRAHSHDIYELPCYRLRTLAVMNAKAVFAVGEAGADGLRVMAGDKSNNVRMGRLGSSKLFPDRMSDHHSAADREITFFSVSRVSVEKRVALNFRLIKALAVARPSTRVRWIHVGDGPLMPELAAIVSRDCPANLSVELKGALANSDVQRIYATEKIDWTMLLSTSEGLPISVCESLSYGVPVVATMVRGTDEIVTDDCGLLLDADPEPEEFVRGILPYIESDIRMDCLREAAFEKWTTEFDAAPLRKSFVEKISRI